jgi:cytochrome c553
MVLCRLGLRLVVNIVILASFSPVASAQSELNPLQKAKLDKAMAKLSELSQMRENLAASIDPKQEITQQTFAQTCMPVGKALKAWSKSQGYQVKQISEKYRNSAHKPAAQDIDALKAFAKQQDKRTITKIANDGSITLYQRINTVTSCLNCHGEKDKRPQFIKDTYPHDKAFGFEPGQLRGAFVVSIPTR